MNENRIPKWLTMLKNWNTWITTPKLYRKIKLRCRKGIPEKLRGIVWMTLTKANILKQNNPGIFYNLLIEPVETTLVDGIALGVGTNNNSSSSSSTAFIKPTINTCNIINTDIVLPTSSSSLPPSNNISHPPINESFRGIIDTIERDISRTFPSLEMFHDAQGTGQASLFRILVAYARYDPEVSYCQGMGFIVALFLTYLSEEDTFWLLVSIMRNKKHALHAILSPGLPLVDMKLHILQGLINHYLPKLSKQLSKELIHCTMYATQWILTIYIYSFPFEIVVRIWDSFLCEGWKMVYRIAICILQAHEKKFCNAKSFEEIMEIFKLIPYSLTANIQTNTSANGSTTTTPTTSKPLHPLPPTDFFLRNTLDIADKLINEAIKLSIHQKDIEYLEDEWKAYTLYHHTTCSTDAGIVLQRNGYKELSESIRQEYIRLQHHRQINDEHNNKSKVRPISWGKPNNNSNL